MATLLSTCTELLTFSVASQQYWVHSVSQRKKLRLRKEKEVSRVTQLVRVYGTVEQAPGRSEKRDIGSLGQEGESKEGLRGPETQALR